MTMKQNVKINPCESISDGEPSHSFRHDVIVLGLCNQRNGGWKKVSVEVVINDSIHVTSLQG
jgi:hypothetical protein